MGLRALGSYPLRREDDDGEWWPGWDRRAQRARRDYPAMRPLGSRGLCSGDDDRATRLIKRRRERRYRAWRDYVGLWSLREPLQSGLDDDRAAWPVEGGG
jgi:hypothetical protein